MPTHEPTPPIPSIRKSHPGNRKLEAVRLVKAGHNIAEAARALGLPLQTVHNWIKAEQVGKLFGVKFDTDEIACLLDCCTRRLQELQAHLVNGDQAGIDAERRVLERLRTKLEVRGGRRPDPDALPSARSRPTPRQGSRTVARAESTPLASAPGDKVNKLLDAVRVRLHLKNDAALSDALGVEPPVISKLRHHRLAMRATMLMRLHEVTGWSVRELKRMLDPNV